jgi:hypothetical protein
MGNHTRCLSVQAAAVAPDLGWVSDIFDVLLYC